jgi:hypothetical protein
MCEQAGNIHPRVTTVPLGLQRLYTCLTYAHGAGVRPVLERNSHTSYAMQQGKRSLLHLKTPATSQT